MQSLQTALDQRTVALEQLAQDLAASKLRYRNILNNLPDLVCCFLINGRISFANHAYCQFFNQPLESILGSDFFCQPPAEQAALRQQVEQLLQTKGSITYQQQVLVQNPTQSPQTRWIEWTNCAICDDTGQVIEFEAIGRDITVQQAALQERQQAETTLRASELRYRAIIEAMPDLLLRVQRDGTCLDCILPKNADPKQFMPVQHHISEALHPELLQVKLDTIAKALETGELQICEHSLVRQDRVFHEEIRTIACGEDEVLLMVRDVTQRRQNELQFQRLAENVPGIVYRYMLHPDGQEQLTYVSPRCREILEVEAEELLIDLERFWTLIHPADQAQIRQNTAASAQTLQPWGLEFRILTPSGLLKWIRAFAQPEPQINGTVIWDGLMVEITESKRANTALQASEAKLRSILENTPSVISLIDRRGMTLFINRSLSGRSATTLVGCNLTVYLTPEQPDQLNAALIAAFEQGESSQFDAIGIGRTQLTAHYEVYIAPVRNTSPIEAAIVIAIDITVRKQAETALRKREAQLLLALEAGKIVCWEHDLVSQQVSCIGEHKAADQWLPTNWQVSEAAYFELIHPDDRERVQQAFQAALSGLSNFEDLHRLNFLDQSVWVLSKGKIFADATGSRKRMVGVSINISERKRIEDSLVAQQAFLRNIINVVSSSIFVKDATGRFLTANQAAADIYGTSVEELEGKSDLDFNPDLSQVEEFWQINQQVIQSMQPIVIPAQAIRNTRGERRWYHIKSG